MKKLLLAAVALGTLALGACSSDYDYRPDHLTGRLEKAYLPTGDFQGYRLAPYEGYFDFSDVGDVEPLVGQVLKVQGDWSSEPDLDSGYDGIYEVDRLWLRKGSNYWIDWDQTP